MSRLCHVHESWGNHGTNNTDSVFRVAAVVPDYLDSKRFVITDTMVVMACVSTCIGYFTVEYMLLVYAYYGCIVGGHRPVSNLVAGPN